MNEQLTINEAIASIRNYISGYGAGKKRLYEGVFKKVETFSQTWDGPLGQDMLFAFYEELTGVKAFVKPKECRYIVFKQAGALINIFHIMNGERFYKKTYFFDVESTLDKWFQPLLNDYKKWQQDRCKSTETIKTREGRIKVLFIYLEEKGIQNLANASIDDFVTFPKYLNDKGYTSQGTHNILYTVRDYLKMPGILEKMSCNPIPLFSNMHTNKHERLPSFYSSDEIQQAIASIDRSTHVGRLAYATILLASIYGIRTKDVLTLELDDIDWDENKISFMQQKTKKQIVLPLLPEVRFALLDYIKNSRPKSSLASVFLRNRAPFEPYTGNRTTLLVYKAFREAGIDTTGKHRGMHSLRHSLATNLTKLCIPLNETTTILGHSCMTTTLKYVWSDLTHLRLAAEEVPVYANEKKV